MIPITAEILDESRALLETHPALSARDALHAAVVRIRGLQEIVSFDRDFDGIEGVKRFFSVLVLAPDLEPQVPLLLYPLDDLRAGGDGVAEADGAAASPSRSSADVRSFLKLRLTRFCRRSCSVAWTLVIRP